jgi:RNA polymerase sigma-70 factor, ECF subfamily
VSDSARKSAAEVARTRVEPCLDPESRAWLDVLRAEGAAREDAVRRLHAFLLRAARFELRKRASGPQLRGEQLDDVATEAADDALVKILAHLEEFRGASRFTTWACKFAILETSVALRKRMWKGREQPFDGDWRRLVPTATGPGEEAEQLELLQALRAAVGQVLTEHQREVFVAVALNDVPIDIVAARSGCTRGAVYKTLHDARRKLREQLEQLSASGAAGRPPQVPR